MKKSYKNGECPDCGDPIPKRTSDGDECKNCGHVFYKLKDTTKKNTHTENADEVINAITETLLRASGEEIEAAAKAVGLNVTYVGDSLFEVKT